MVAAARALFVGMAGGLVSCTGTRVVVMVRVGVVVVVVDVVVVTRAATERVVQEVTNPVRRRLRLVFVVAVVGIVV